MQISQNLHFPAILQVDLRWLLALICDLLTAWTYEGSHIISLNQLWFQSDINFSNEAIFTLSAYLTTWPRMTFDLSMWPLTSSTNEGSHAAPVSSFAPIGLQLFNWGQFYIFSLSYNLTSYDLWLCMWPLTSSTNEGSHVTPRTQVWLKSIKACGSCSQMLKVDVPILTCIFFTFNWLTLTSEMLFVKFHPQVASCLLSRGKRMYVPLWMRLLWKYIRNYFLVYHLISPILLYLQN